MKNRYIFVEKSDVSQEMLNFSTSSEKGNMRSHESNSLLLSEYALFTQLHVVEFCTDCTEHTSVFNSYKWRNAEETRGILENDV